MSQETVKKTECKDQMSNLEKAMRRMFWIAILAIVGLLGSAFTFYYNQQEKKIDSYKKAQTEKINKIAVASIKADERLEVRLTKAEQRQIEVEKQQAAMGARIDANMKWLMDACSRIETKQTRIEERLDK